MNGLTRRVLLAGAALLPATSVIKARAGNANEAGDSALLDLVAQWWRIENAVSQDGLTDDERDDLTRRQDPIARAIAATPARTPHGLSAKLHVYGEYSTASMESEWACERVLASVMQDAERLGGAS